MRVCADCARTRPRCRECNIPMAGPAPDSAAGPGLCATCSRSLKVCLACGRPVKGRYYSFDGVGPYCAECRRSRPPCDVCGAPLTQEYWQLSDGRLTCATCHATAVYSPEAAAGLYDEIKAVVAGDLDLRLNIPTGLALVDRNQLRQVIEQQLAPGNGGRSAARLAQPPPPSDARPLPVHPLDADNTLGLYARRGMRRGIYIQTGLPRLLFLQIAAHEYAHAWQGENCPMLRDPLIHEGFAEWVAYRVVSHYGYERGLERMRKRQDIYGDGLRWALDLEQRFGPPSVVEACRRQQVDRSQPGSWGQPG